MRIAGRRGVGVTANIDAVWQPSEPVKAHADCKPGTKCPDRVVDLKHIRVCKDSCLLLSA